MGAVSDGDWRGVGRRVQDSPRLRLNAFVLPTTEGQQDGGGVTVDNLGDVTQTAGIVFERFKITVNGIPGSAPPRPCPARPTNS